MTEGSAPDDGKVLIQDLTKIFEGDHGTVVALDRVNATIREGEFVCILGPSGCGKTTLLRIVGGLEQPTEGKIYIGGRAVVAPGPERAFVFQEYALFPWKTVLENIEFGLHARGVPPENRREVSTKLVEVMQLIGFENAYPHTLSGGMQQRVSIARALAVDPEVLLMDEPFGALDAQTRFSMQRELLRVWEIYRKTLVFVTHSIDEALYLADRILMMSPRPGRIVEELRVEIPRPRSITGEEFMRMKAHMLEILATSETAAAAV
ncbi:MAG: ABC transporter ATP-binding protein [bacterium]